MKKLTLLMMLMFATMQAWAAPVDEATALAYIQSLLNNQYEQQTGYETQSTASTTGGGNYHPSVQILHKKPSSVNSSLNTYYIVTDNNKYYIFAGDDRFGHILGYGDGTLDMDNIPCGMQFLLDMYSERIDYLLAHPGLVIETPVLYALPSQLPKAIQLITPTWGQEAPFNNLCPTINGQLCVAGCSCTALAQVMYYWKYPAMAPAVKSLPATALDWDGMLDKYTNSYSTAQADAVATLMQYVGQAENMKYGVQSSTAPIKSIRNAANSFHYRHSSNGNGGILCWATLGNNDAWRDSILAELRADRPVVYVGSNEASSLSHSFVVDGYTTDGLFHINWGFNGNYNGFFSLNDFNPTLGNEGFTPEDSAFNAFNYNQMIITGLMPDCRVELSEDSLSFVTNPESTATKCFTVTGELYEDLNLRLYPENNGFIIDKTVITKAAAACGDTVHISYTPTKEGKDWGRVIISGSGIETTVVYLNGDAVSPVPVPDPVVIADVDSIDFGAVEVGYPVKKNIQLSGMGLTQDINLRVETRSVNYFTVSPETITPEQAAEGVSVTVTYSPGSEYWTEGDLIVSSPETEDKVIPITADPYYPECFRDNQTVFFEANMGKVMPLTTKTGAVRFFDAQIDPPYPGVTPELMSNGDGTTFNVLPNLDGIDNYSLTLTGNPCFSARIVKASAIANICTVTISYNPSAPGEHNATLTLYCSTAGVPTVTIPLHGTATAPTPYLYPADESDVTDTSFDARWRCGYLGNELSSFTLECSPQGTDFDPDNADYHLITDLSPDDCAEPTPFFQYMLYKDYRYTIDGLQPGTTYCYRVKACFTDGAESEWSDVETVTLIGIGAGINVNVKSLTFEDIYTGGYETSRTITITGVDLSNDIQLSLANDGLNSYRLSKHTITPEEAATGATVTVYFRADRHIGGIRTATLNIESAGYETVSIPLSGKAIKSDGYIISTPGSLSFETHVGTPVTKTFTVHYSKSNGNDCIMISNVNGNDATNDGDDADSNGEMLKMQKDFDLTVLISKDKLPGGATVGPGNFSPDWSSLSGYNPGIIPFIRKGLQLQVIGDGCYNITPTAISNLNNSSISDTITVTYNPQSAGSHEAYILITTFGISARPLKVPLHGTATDGFLAAPGNGRVTIADVTDLIDLLISGEDLPATADKNGDGQVNIIDVTTLIDRMLEQQ